MNIESFYNSKTEKRFFFPGKVIVGADCSRHVSVILQSYRSIAFVVDQFFLNSQLLKSLLGFHKSNSPIYTKIVSGRPYVEEIIDFRSTFSTDVEAIVAIGGGSATDFAKALVLLCLYDDIDGIGIGERRGEVPTSHRAKPIFISIPTTAGSGAEASRYFVTYSRASQGKVHGKSWLGVADWIFLDPNLLQSVPNEILVACAFDSFVHFFESFIIKEERSPFGDMLSLHGLPLLMHNLDIAITCGRRDALVDQNLLYTATLAGIAISNIRTGNVHEAAGALLEVTDLSHPESLFVFFREAILEYADAVSDRERLLIQHLHLYGSLNSVNSLSELILWWESLFINVGLDARIKESVARAPISRDEMEARIFNRVWSDKVWVNKESPVLITEESLRLFIQRSLSRFDLSIS